MLMHPKKKRPEGPPIRDVASSFLFSVCLCAINRFMGIQALWVPLQKNQVLCLGIRASQNLIFLGSKPPYFYSFDEGFCLPSEKHSTAECFSEVCSPVLFQCQKVWHSIHIKIKHSTQKISIWAIMFVELNTK